MSFDELLANAGGFKNLFELVRKKGLNLESEVEKLLKQESGLFSIVGFSVKKVTEEYAELSFPFSHQIERHGGMVHGGIISYALDIVGGLAVMAQNTGIDQVTLELKVNFLEPVRKDPFRVIGRTIRQGRTTAVAEAELRDGEDKLCAKALGTWYLISSRNPS
jgi:acyl-CoA thioesterase